MRGQRFSLANSFAPASSLPRDPTRAPSPLTLTTRLLALCLAAALGALAAGCGGSGDSDGTAEGADWSHSSADPALAPKAWGTIDESFVACGTGKEQSPVDLTKVVDADLPPLEFSYPRVRFTVENTGHTIEATMPEGSNLTLTVGDDVYRLEQFHFHTPSEHTVRGKSYPAELHLVHRSETGELAVVGIFVESSSLPQPLIDQVIENAGAVGEEIEMPYAESPLEMLLDLEPPDATVEGYYEYSGSLTTPPCTEGIRWLVFDDIHVIDLATVGYFQDVVAGFPGYEGFRRNNRPTQPLNGRTIEHAN